MLGLSLAPTHQPLRLLPQPSGSLGPRGRPAPRPRSDQISRESPQPVTDGLLVRNLLNKARRRRKFPSGPRRRGPNRCDSIVQRRVSGGALRTDL